MRGDKGWVEGHGLGKEEITTLTELRKALATKKSVFVEMPMKVNELDSSAAVDI